MPHMVYVSNERFSVHIPNVHCMYSVSDGWGHGRRLGVADMWEMLARKREGREAGILTTAVNSRSPSLLFGAIHK